jgi:hypothetical protein
MDLIRSVNKLSVNATCFLFLVVENGPLASASSFHNTRFPVIVFSPGNGSMRTTYSILCTEIASRKDSTKKSELLELPKSLYQGNTQVAVSKGLERFYYSELFALDYRLRHRLRLFYCDFFHVHSIPFFLGSGFSM